MTFDLWWNWKGKSRSLGFQWDIFHKLSTFWPLFIRNTDQKSSMNYQFTSRHFTLDKFFKVESRSHDFKRLYLLNGGSYTIFHEHLVNHIRYMVFQFTSWHLTLGGIERSNQGHLVFIGLYIILGVLLDSGAVGPRGLLL